ncbi:hypothetical protein D5H75_17420 [Bailinhaonella thermotolerans]|uniref:YtxH domain-containing protein n=2 Tax=Bailinhaonella thermotolerans TaxID=1070861 RepID=A0A3A4ASH8_9ACTN|nr:hypothetical protein D5H75_17420 [Bailinhaonella thermotolerans]
MAKDAVRQARFDQVRGQVVDRAQAVSQRVGPMTLTARAWMAPRIDRAAQSLESDIAPRMARFMSNTAHRIEPRRMRQRRRWPLMVLLVGSAAAVAGIVMQRRSGGQWSDATKADAADWAGQKIEQAGDKVEQMTERAADRVSRSTDDRH